MLNPDLAPSLHSEGISPQPPLLRGELELEDGVRFNSRGVEEADIPQLLCEQMRHGQCLMLLDGLDEVFDQESRRLIVERINQFVEMFSANKFVVTSRIAGYRDVKLSERFAEFTIEDMGSEQVERFLHRWCRAVEQAQQPDASQEQWQRVGDEQTREILAAIQANEGVKRLTANPLLLTILALIHRNGSRLPHRRVELYALAVKRIALAYWRLGRIYQEWGKYEQAIAHYQQSRELNEQLGKQKNVANLWYGLGDGYRDWGKYEQAVECELKDLAICQQLDDQPGIALAYWRLGRIYQAWGKYEQAIAHYRQSRELYEQLGQEQDVAKLWSLLAACYGDWGKYEQAIEYCQQSLTLCQKLGLEQGSAWNFRAIANSQRLLAKNTPDTAEASNLLTQAEQNIRPAIQLNTAGDYKENLAYDYTALGLLYSERLRLLAPDDSSLPEQIAQFEAYYNTGLTYLTELGETVDRADETLDMARAYLEVSALENLNQAEALAQESLQIFQDYNRRKLEAAARKLLGEIYLKRAQRNQANAEAIAHQFLSESLQLYRELDLTEKAAEVEQLMLFSGE